MKGARIQNVKGHGIIGEIHGNMEGEMSWENRR